MAVEAKMNADPAVSQLERNMPDKGSSSTGSTKVAPQKYKIQIQLSPSSRDRLEQLVLRTEVESSTQVIRDALRVYDILVEEVSANGSSLFLKTKDDEVVKLRLF